MCTWKGGRNISCNFIVSIFCYRRVTGVEQTPGLVARGSRFGSIRAGLGCAMLC